MRLRIPLFAKIMVPLMALIVATTILSGYQVYRESSERIEDEIDTRLRRISELVARSVPVDELRQVRLPNDLDGPIYEAIRTELEQSRNAGNLAWVGIYYRENGYFYYWVDSDYTGVGYPFFHPTPGHIAAYETGESRPVAYTDEFGSFYGVAAPIIVEGEGGEREIIGIVEASVLGETRALVQRDTLIRVVPLLAGGGLAAMLLSLLVVHLFFRRPLRHLHRGVQALGQGSFGTTIALNSRDELGDLAAAFNRMSAQIDQMYHERIAMERAAREREVAQLQASERELEAKVAERTAEIARKNEALARSRDELAIARDQALEANRAKSAFLASTSHELRTPLNAIIGYSELLMEEAEDQGYRSFATDLKRIHGAGHHLLNLINDILDLSKIEAGRMELYLETFSPAHIVKDAIETVRPIVAKSGNTLVVDAPSDLGTMYSDMTKLRQALLNLLSNANKFTHGGTITLTATREAGRGGDWLRFRISDTGIGMTTEQVGKLFQPFTQADASTTRNYGGTGLGLAISQRFCRMLGGTIGVESALGEGSTFTISLPARTSEADQAPEEIIPDGSEPSIPSGARTVLVIDDSANVRDLLTRLLHKEGFHVETASDGQQGLARARELRPDLITLDVSMPIMDGWAVLSQLKADPDLAHIPVVMVTMADAASLGFSLGAADYVTKPFDRDRLIAVLNKYRHARSDTHILVVDDQPEVRQVLRRTLEKEGWQVREAENGRLALAAVEAERPAMILLDLMMPEMDGFEVIERLRQHPDWQSIPVIVVTAKDLSFEERLWLSGSLEKVIQKNPSNETDLLAEVRDLLERHQPSLAVPPP